MRNFKKKVPMELSLLSLTKDVSPKLVTIALFSILNKFQRKTSYSCKSMKRLHFINFKERHG